MFQSLKIFFKMGIVIFALLAGAIGYGVGLTAESSFSLLHLGYFLLGVFFLSSGSLSLNQIQEAKADALMERTSDRPIPTGKISIKLGLLISTSNILIGLGILYSIKPLCGHISLIILFFYNVLYTLWWKKKWAFAAVPGAIPGALPVTLGYAATNSHIFSSESIYLFLVMFSWQMPHFWALAIKLKEDYRDGGFPVLPTALGKERTQFHIALYVCLYAFIAISSPFFVEVGYFYFFLVLPFAVKIVWEFFKFYRSQEERAWLPFFMWINFSMLIFLLSPLTDKWMPFLLGTVVL